MQVKYRVQALSYLPYVGKSVLGEFVQTHAVAPGAIIQSAQRNPLLVENVQRFDSAERTLIRGSSGVATRIRMEWKGNG